MPQPDTTSTTVRSAGQAWPRPEAASHAMQHACKRMPLHVCQPQEIMHALAHLNAEHSCLRTPHEALHHFLAVHETPRDLDSNPTDALAKFGRSVKYNKSQQNTVFKRVQNHRPVITFSSVRMLTRRLPAGTLAYCREGAFLQRLLAGKALAAWRAS